MTRLITPFAAGTALDPEQGGTGVNGDLAATGQILAGGGPEGLQLASLIAGDNVTLDFSQAGKIVISAQSGVPQYPSASITVLGNDAYKNGDIEGAFITAVGWRALEDCQSDGNTAVGAFSGGAVTTGGNNTLVGSFSGNAITTGTDNVNVGRLAGSSISTGHQNICIGASSNIGADGSNNIIIGRGATATGTTPTNRVVIGSNTAGTRDNEVILGTAETKSLKLGNYAVPFIVAQNNAAVAHTGNTVKTTLASAVIPGGAMMKNGSVEIDFLMAYTVTVDAIVLIDFGASNARTITLAAGSGSLRINVWVRNANSEASQVCFGNASDAASNTGFGVSTSFTRSLAIDTTQDTTLALAAILGASDDNVVLRGYCVTIRPSE